MLGYNNTYGNKKNKEEDNNEFKDLAMRILAERCDKLEARVVELEKVFSSSVACDSNSATKISIEDIIDCIKTYSDKNIEKLLEEKAVLTEELYRLVGKSSVDKVDTKEEQKEIKGKIKKIDQRIKKMNEFKNTICVIEV